MGRKRQLNGIPDNLVRSYFGTMRYYGCGYMGDWLFFAAKKLNIKEAVIDIYNETIKPHELQLKPLMLHLPSLKDIIKKELLNNGFSGDYFETAIIKINFPGFSGDARIFYCTPVLIGKDGNEVKAMNIQERAYEDEFDPFNKEVGLAVEHTGKKIIRWIKSLLVRK